MEWILITIFWLNGTAREQQTTYPTKEICQKHGEAWKKEMPPQSSDIGTSYYHCVPQVKDTK